MHVIAAKAVALKEAARPSFVAYQQSIVDNAKALADGLMKREGDTVYLGYEESEMTGMEGTTTTFAVGKDNVVLTRTGAIQSQMIFEKGKQNVGLYDLGFGAMTIGVKARRLKSTLGPEGGRLEISYGIEIEQLAQGLNTFVIDVRKPAIVN